ncbi:MAG: MBL fold metallo-hydrolase [Sulfolobales archaeon]|nr:MBL fold metallo-hydrolase [Sulfolobales archaeon]
MVLEVLSGIHVIRGEVSNIYLVDLGAEVLLVDAGTPSDPGRVLSYVTTLRKRIGAVFVTHAHWDHVGGLKYLKKETGARVVAHRDEVPYVRGDVAGRRRFEPVEVDVVVDDGSELLGLLVIHTPGHTPGSSCLLDRGRKALFVGDLVYEEGGALHEMHHHYSRDPQKNRESIAKLLNYDFTHVFPSHGNPILWRSREILESLVESFQLR